MTQLCTKEPELMNGGYLLLKSLFIVGNIEPGRRLAVLCKPEQSSLLTSSTCRVASYRFPHDFG